MMKCLDHNLFFTFIASMQDFYDTDEQAYNEVKRGRAWGALIFPSNFTEGMSGRVEYGSNVDNFSIEASEVEIRMDMSSENRTN